MLTDIFLALLDHLSALGLPFYLADCVPQGAELPYLTADIQPPLRTGEAGSLTLCCWCAGDAANPHRIAEADRLAAQFPHRGLWLSTDSGALILTPEKGVHCLAQQTAKGIVFRFQLHFFPRP